MATENEHRLKTVGPIDPDHGFPLWFEDENNLRLELGLNPDPLTPAIGELPIPGKKLSFPDNFPDEIFYFLAEARLTVAGTGRAKVILALEAAFGGDGNPQQGLNVVFARIRVRMDGLTAGTKYTVTHPYGVIDPDKLEADERGRVFYTEDLGIVEGNPTAVLRSGKVAPFLQWSSAAPDGYIGDGVSERQITGSPFGTNFVRIEGPQIGSGTSNPDLVETNVFTVQGRKTKRVGAWLEGAAYNKVSDNNYLLIVQARSDENQDLRLVASGVHIKLVGEDKFYTGLAQVTSLPSDAELVNVSDSPPTRYPVKKFVDRVIVESATHDRVAGVLTIKARSSDASATLSIPQLGLTLASNPQSFPRIAVPAKIIVKSSLGGEGRQWVEVIGNPDGNLPVAAIIAPVLQAFADESIELDGSGSLGATAFSWIQTAGPTTGTLTNANAAKATFTPSQAGNYTFNLNVQGGGSSASADITFAVDPAPGPDTLTVDRRDYRTSSRQFRIDGSVLPTQVPNEIVVTFKGEELGRGIADIDGNWSVKKTLLQSQSNLVPVPGDSVEVSSKRSGGAQSFNIIIRN
jgi:hypothetical protein